MDAVLLAAVAREWHASLKGARVDRAFSPDPHRLDIALRQGGREERLAFSLRPGEARCHPALDAPPNPAVPSGFCMFLRRHLTGSRVLAVEAQRADRLLVVRLRSENEIGVEDLRTLHFEAFGPRPNLILVDGQGRVMDAFRRVSAAGEGARAILPGLRYTPLAPGHKDDPFDLGPDGLVERLEGAAPVDRLADLLVRSVRGFAPVWAREVLAMAGLDGDASGRDVATARDRLREALARFLSLLGGEAPHPCVAYGPDGQPLGAFPQPPRQFGPAVTVRSWPTVGEAVAAYHGEHDRALRLEQRRSALMKSLDKRRARLAQKLARQDQEWREAEADLALRHQGELLLAHAHAIAPGAREAEVEDWQPADGAAPGTRVRLALDPERSASENAERLFARYRKARRRHDALGGEMARARRELEYMESVADELRRADEVEVLDALALEVESAGALGPPPGVAPAPAKRVGGARGRRAKPGKAAGPRAPEPARAAAPRPLTYRTPGGLTVQVGRTGYENDRLSLRLAAPDDLWFHVAHGPGAHAVMRLGDRPPGFAPAAEDMAAAAMLAAYHSPGRASSHVEVDHCRCGRLRKAPGARPGLVLYDREGSLSVTPDAQRVEAMREAARAQGTEGPDGGALPR